MLIIASQDERAIFFLKPQDGATISGDVREFIVIPLLNHLSGSAMVRFKLVERDPQTLLVGWWFNHIGALRETTRWW